MSLLCREVRIIHCPGLEQRIVEYMVLHRVHSLFISGYGNAGDEEQRLVTSGYMHRHSHIGHLDCVCGVQTQCEHDRPKGLAGWHWLVKMHQPFLAS